MGFNWSQWQVEQLKALERYKAQNKKKFTKSFSNINDSIDAMIFAARQEGGTEQEQKILRALKKGLKASKVSQGAEGAFFRLNTRKLNALIKATKSDFSRAEKAMLRMSEDKYRQIIFNAQVYANTGAGTYEKAVDMATKDFLKAGINCIEYANGARHTMKDYAKMAIQTANKRAYLTGEGEMRQSWGISTVIMNKRANACPKCLPFVGKILIDDVWSGGDASDGNYPLMSSAIAAGLYHPNCKDVHTGMTGDGKYTFKIVPVGGDTQGTAIESAEVSYQKPLAQSTITANGSASKISVNWTAVDGATSYDLYRTLGSNGSAELITTTAGLTYEDTNVKTEEPYCYYVVAKNDNNESNPSVKVQTLASDGHVGEYVVENEAAKLTVTDKSNDTIASDSASITMKSDRAGSVKLVLNGKEVSTQSVKADEEFKLELSGLVQARNDVEVLFTDENNQTTRKTFNFVSKPKYDIVVDAAFAGNDGDVVDGHATYKTVQAAVNSVPADNAESKVIFIKNGEYNERVTVEVPNVSLLGEDAEKTHIYYSAAISEGTATDMWTRNAMYVGSDADGFTAENLTVENSFAYTNGSDQQADALCIVADKTACVNVRLVGYQDTLLTDSRVKGADGNYEVTRQYFSKCYITGNVDFIYGSGSSYFDDCDIVARYTPYKSDGCYTAPRTYASTDYGMVFNECRFTAEEGVGDGQYRLSRPWGADASTTFINCYIGRAVQSVGYGDMSGNLYKDARFAEYGSYGPGYYVNNDRPLLTSDEAKLFAEEKVMEDYDAEAVVKALYKADDSSTPDNPKPEDPKPADPTPGTPSDDKPADNTQVKDDNKAPQTGDKAPLAALASLLGLSGLGLFASTKKKRV